MRQACCAGDVKEFGFRGVPSGRVPPEAELPPLQPVPALAPGMVADPRLALTIGVSGSIASEQVQRLPSCHMGVNRCRARCLATGN